MHTKTLGASAVLLVFTVTNAVAESPTPLVVPEQATYDLGARVGGYGFKREGDDRIGTGWTECRMNGIGVFASRMLTGPLFVEAGLDMYTSGDFPMGPSPMDLPIDRMSGLLSMAGGARAQLATWLRGYVQLGAGVELTRVSVPYGDKKLRDTQVMPEGFVGVGLDIRVARQTYVGASFRTLMMGNYEYSRQQLEENQTWGWEPDPAVVLDASLDFAAQGQFYVRRDL